MTDLINNLFAIELTYEIVWTVFSFVIDPPNVFANDS